MTVAGYLRRRKRDLDLLAADPGAEKLCRAVLLSGGGMLLAAIPGQGGCLPLGAALAAATKGGWCLLAALGAAGGYRLFWQSRWLPGLWFTALALALHLAALLARQGGLLLRGRLPGGVDPRLGHGHRPPHGRLPDLLPGAAGSGGGGAERAGLRRSRRRRGGRAPPHRRSGWGRSGVVRASGVYRRNVRGLDAPGPARRAAAGSAGCILGMALGKSWNIGAWLGVSTGGLLGAALPWDLLLPPGTRGTSGAQVKLEQEARVLAKMQRLLLEIPGSSVSMPDRVERLKAAACTDCLRADTCPRKQAMDDSIFLDPLSFSCPHTGRVLREAARVREQQRLLEAQHKRREEYRMAVAQQYGMLSRYLQRVADGLPLQLSPGQIRYRVTVSVRSREKDRSDGDRCAAFPGTGPRFYILLCDGMGTGAPAAAQACQAVHLLKGMLTAGLPPGAALKSLNAQLLLTGDTGAVTADLCELRLDTGYASLYKWGAAPSYLLSRKTLRRIGAPGLPPGMELGSSGERIARLSLQKGQTLVLASDGVTFDESLSLPDTIEPTGPLADRLLRQYGSTGEDDATLAVIRLGPMKSA